MKPRPKLENESEQYELCRWLEGSRELAESEGHTAFSDMCTRAIRHIDNPWIKPSEDLPKAGDLIAVKWKNSNHYDYDCWEYWPDKGQGCNWDDALCWMKLPRPVVAGEKS